MATSTLFNDFSFSKFGRESRDFFFTNPDVTSLNHGSFGTIPIPIQRASEALTRECESNPDSFIRVHLFKRIATARMAVAEVIGVDSDTCVFINNVSTAMNTVLHNFKWSPDDYIISTDAIFQSITLAIENVPRNPRKSVFNIGDFATNAESILHHFRQLIKDIKKEIEARSHKEVTKSNDYESPKIVAVIETITASPSYLLPWREMVRICHEEEVWSVVDGAHSLGQEKEIKLSEVDPDFWMTNCSKWYYAQRGCAVLYVPFRNQGMIEKQLVPGVCHPVRDMDPSAFVHKFFWSGQTDPVPMLSVEFAIAFRKLLGGEDKINDYCHDLAVAGGRLVAKMLDTTVLDTTESGELTANMTNIALPIQAHIKPSNEIFFIFEDELIDTHKVFAPPFYYQGRWWARASAQIYNDISDFERLGKALQLTCQKINRLYGTEAP